MYGIDGLNAGAKKQNQPATPNELDFSRVA
jgi:hypothetical protein